MKKFNCILLLFEILLYLAVFPLSRAQIQDTTNYPDSIMPSDDKNVCNSPECIRTASRVLRYMNRNLDPCENFYEFSCGQFINTSLILGHNSADQYLPIQQTIRQASNVYLRNKTLPTSPKYATLIKTFYSNCINQFPNNIKNFTAIWKLINETSGWPFLKGDSWQDENFQWEKFGYLTENITVFDNYFIYLTTIVDKNNSYRSLKIQKPINNAFNRNLKELREIGQLFGVNNNEFFFNLMRMNRLYRKLNVYPERNVEDNSFERMSVKKLIQRYPYISWKTFFDTRLQPNNVDGDEVILVNNIDYFDNLNNIITTISKRDQADYLMWRAIYNILEVYIKSINLIDKPLDLCYDSVVNTFENSFGLLYLKNNLNKDTFPKDVDEMFNNIYKQFVTIVKNNSWIVNETTKLKALDKLESLTMIPPSYYFSFNDEEIDEYYKNLEITPGDYFESLINITKFKIDKSNEQLINSLVKKTSWTDLPSATTVSAGNDVERNFIVAMPGIFQGVLFNKERPQYMNYGSIGHVIGHELAHTLDNIGRDYDKTGNIVNWWDAESDKVFLSKIQCIIDQRNNYRVEEIGMNLNGNQTKSEDTSDIVGVKLAYLAYETYMETHGPEPLLPGVNYTQRQLFWISCAQKVCATMTTEELKYIVEFSEYSTPEFRVIGSLANSFEFARDFHCKSGAKMNPEKKCSVW